MEQKRKIQKEKKKKNKKGNGAKIKSAVAGDRTRVTRVTGGNTHHYTTTTQMKA